MKLTQDTIARINLFEKITSAGVKDCLEEEEGLTFVIQEGNVKKALGQDNSNIRRLEGIFKRKIKIIAFSNDPVKFINNLLYPVKADTIELKDESIVITAKDSVIKGKIFGRSKTNLEKIKKLVKKYFNIDEVKVI